MTPRNWQQVKETFHEALRLDSGERDQFLDKACDGDIEFRIEVESLLISLAEAKNFLEQPVIGEMPQPDSTWRLTDGQIISHYRIVSHIASGGMGEVYLAEDEKLGRRVALKILPEAILADRNRLRRFRREAEVISALNHPNILTIFEFGDDNDLHFFASELVKGETLRARLKNGRLTLHDTLEIAIQIASALRAAHEAGVIHRDIKPENVMIRDDGYVKVLDFGLAKLTERVPTDSANVTKEFLSQPGVIMGTVSYMSPEQARARSTDARSDLFSFGVVLFEMLTGHVPFAGETTPDVIAGIIQSDPRPASSYNSSVPAEMDRIIAKCLEKDRDIRYQTAADLLADLKRLSKSGEPAREQWRQEPSTLMLAPATEARSWLSKRKLIAASALLIALASVAAIWKIISQNRNQASSNLLASLRIKQLVSWDVEAGEGYAGARFSPNGTMIAYSLTKNGQRNIWTKQVPDGKPNPITDGKWDYYNPIWSPDGQRIAFVSDRDDQTAIWEMPFSGGELTLIKSTEGKAITLLRWSNDGSTIYCQQGNNLFSLDIASRQITQLTVFDSTSGALHFAISPEEDRIAYQSGPNERLHVFVKPLRGGESVQVTNGETSDEYPFWLPDGKRIIYACKRDGVYQTCVAYLDEQRTEQINLGISDTLITDVARDGSKILFSQTREESDLWRVSIGDKSESQIVSDSGLEFWPDVSPDGKSIVFQSTTEAKHLLEGSILIHSIDDEQRTKIVSNGFSPAFSPDGRKIAFLRFAGNLFNLWIVGKNGADEIKLTTEDIWWGSYSLLPYNRVQVKDYSWSVDGRDLIYCAKKDGLSNVWRVSADGASQSQQISNNMDAGAVFSCPLFAPDGKRIGYTLTATKPSAGNKTMTDLGIIDGGNTETVFSTESAFKLIGWGQNGSDMLIAMPEDKPAAKPINIKLIIVSPGKAPTDLASIENAYFYNVQLSPDGRRIALVTREDGKDNIRVISRSGGESVRITADLSPNDYISSIAWSPDSKTIYYGKQKKEKMISMIENFK